MQKPVPPQHVLKKELPLCHKIHCTWGGGTWTLYSVALSLFSHSHHEGSGDPPGALSPSCLLFSPCQPPHKLAQTMSCLHQHLYHSAGGAARWRLGQPPEHGCRSSHEHQLLPVPDNWRWTLHHPRWGVCRPAQGDGRGDKLRDNQLLARSEKLDISQHKCRHILPLCAEWKVFYRESEDENPSGQRLFNYSQSAGKFLFSNVWNNKIKKTNLLLNPL